MTAIKTYFRHQVCKDGYKLDKIFLPKQSGPKSYELKNFKEKDLHEALIEFINISQLIDKGADSEETILSFINKYGLLMDLEMDQSIINANKKVTAWARRGGSFDINVYYQKSDWFRQVINLHRKNRKKLAREKFNERGGYDIALMKDIEGESIRPLLMPLNLDEAMHWTLSIALSDIRPIRVCAECGKIFQRSKQSRQCSDACKQRKSNRSKK